MSARVWWLVAALASVLGVVALSFVDLARATTEVSPNCAQRAAYLTLVTTSPSHTTRRAERRASTVLGETARPQRHGRTDEPRAPPARTRERGQPKDSQGLAYDSGNRLRQLGDTTFERDTNGQIAHSAHHDRPDRSIVIA